MDATIVRLGKPVAAEENPGKAQAQLEEQRQDLLQEAMEVAKVQTEFDRSMREYDAPHNLRHVTRGPSRMG